MPFAFTSGHPKGQPPPENPASALACHLLPRLRQHSAHDPPRVLACRPGSLETTPRLKNPSTDSPSILTNRGSGDAHWRSSRKRDDVFRLSTVAAPWFGGDSLSAVCERADREDAVSPWRLRVIVAFVAAPISLDRQAFWHRWGNTGDAPSGPGAAGRVVLRIPRIFAWQRDARMPDSAPWHACR